MSNDPSKPVSHRSRTARTLLLAASLASFGAVPACSSSSGNTVDSGPIDKPSNGFLTINEATITGTIANRVLSLELPVAATGAQNASGALNVRLTSVDGSTVLSSSSVRYDVKAGDNATLTTTFPMPDGASTQADLVLFNVAIDDGSPMGIRLTKSLLHTVKPYEVRVEGPARLSVAKKASYRVRAQNPKTRQPLADVPIVLTLSQNDKVVQTLNGKTSATGDASFTTEIDDPGAYKVAATMPEEGIAVETGDSVNVEAAGPKLLVTTDKPIYKPGQTLHLRALALSRDSNKPIGATPALFEIEDAKGNKIFKKSITTDSYGISATTFTLGSLVNLGTFKIRVTVGDVKSEKAVTVSQYALPKFDVAVRTDRPWYRPGEDVTGIVDARYFFGKLVSGGDVTIEASTLDVGQTPFQKIVGKLDDQGHYQFTAKLPSVLAGIPLEQGKAAVTFKITVTDTAGQVVEKSAAVTVSKHGLAVTVVPEATVLVPGMDNELLVFVTDPLGAPAAAANVQVTPTSGQTITATTDAFGQAVLAWRVPPALATDSVDLKVVASVPGVDTVADSVQFGVQTGKEHLVVRTDKPLYDVGDTVKVDIATTHDGSSVYVDVLNAGQAVAMRTLNTVDNKASFTFDVDPSLVGSDRIEAYLVDASGNVVRAGRTVFARNGHALDVKLQTDKPAYGPGQPAKLTFSVKDEQGKPTVAALGVQIVDQAVFALVDAHPGLLRTFFELEDAYAKPQYEIAGPSVDYDQVFFGRPSDPVQVQATSNLATASFAALGQASPMGIDHGSWADQVRSADQKLTMAYDGAQAKLRSLLTPFVQQIGKDINKTCPPSSFSCGDKSRLEVIQERFASGFRAADFWGGAYKAETNFGNVVLSTKGPDEIQGTSDDKSFPFAWSDLDPTFTSGLFPPTTNPGGFGDTGVASSTGSSSATGGAGGSGLGTGGTGGSGPSGGADEPRVRQDFPETLYVNPAVITSPDGTATLDVNLADSITQWRVSTLAHSADGRLGGLESGVTVFQDFFVDINFPATLTRGDQVSFPIAVYNYLDTPQSVKLDLETADWFTAMGTTTMTIDLAPGQVKGASFPVRVDKVGVRSLTVKAQGSQRSDAVARMVRVVPDGKAFPTAWSGMTETGTADHTFSFPAGTIPGSEQLYVEVYPAFLSQVVNGMDSLLRAPYGCFEQTTSTTWPNVLVMSYLQSTKQITTEIQLKAESLISAGYQRLLTFEHPGGGFSWFGTQDAAPFLSVTAFGVMEFADMAKVSNVDPAMLTRTVDWLVSQQQADGSWKGDVSEFFSFNTSGLRNTAFTLWALKSAGYQGPAIDRAVAFVKTGLQASKQDAYTLGILANALQLAAPDDPATAQTFDALTAAAKMNGDKVSWDATGTQTSFYGSGADADVTSTALALHALLLRGGQPTLTTSALKSITASKDAEGNFGSTQATIWSLRALILAASKGTEGAVGTFSISVDGQPAKTLDLTADQSDVMTTVDLGTFASTGNHAVSLSFAGKGRVSFNAVSKYNLPWTDVTEPAGPLSISVGYDKSTLFVNDTVRATVSVRNNTTSTQNMILVTLGLPPGFEILGEDFAPYLTNGSLSKFEPTGKQLTLYVPTLRPSASLEFSYRLRATMPVKATDGGGEVHAYYEPTRRAFAPASAIEAQGK